MALATLTIDINARLASIEKDMGRAAQIAESNAKRMAEAFSKVGDVFATIGAAGTVAALGAIVKQTADAADALGKLAQKTGITVENLSKLQYAASLADVSNEDLATSFSKLARAMSDTAQGTGSAKDAFAALGISVTDAGGKLKTTDQVFSEIAQRMSEYKDSAEKSAVAQEIFGKSGANLIPLLNSGAQGLREMGDEAERFGVVMSGDLAKASEEFNDNLTRLHTQLTGMRNTVGAELIPVLATATEHMVGFGGANSVAEGAAVALRTALETVVVLGANVAYVFKAVGVEIGGLAAQAAAVATFDFSGAAAIGRAMKEDAALARKEIDDFSASILGASKSTGEFKAQTEAAEKPTIKFAAAQEKVAAGSKKTSDAAREAAKQYKAFADAINRAFDESMAAAEADAELLKIAREGLVTLKDQVQAQQEYSEEIGVTGVALADLKAKRLEDAAAQNTQTAATLASIPGNEQQVEAYEEKARLLRELASLTRVNAAKDATVQAAQDAAAEWERTSQQIEDSLTDALMRGFENGEGFGENFRATLINMFKTLILRPIIAPIAQGVAGGVMQMMGMGSAGMAGGSGWMGMAQNGLNLYRMYQGGDLSIASLGGGYINAAGNAFGSAGLASYGAGMTLTADQASLAADAYMSAGYTSEANSLISGSQAGGFANTAGSYMGYAGALYAASQGQYGQAVGAAIGTYILPGIGTLIGSYLGSLVDKFTGPSYHSGAATLTGIDDSQSLLKHKQIVGDTVVWGGFSEVDAEGGKVYSEPLKKFGMDVANTYENVLKMFGINEQASVYAAFGADGDDNSRGNLRIYDEEGNLLAANGQAKRGAKYNEDAKKGFDEFAADSGRVIRDALVAADLPAWVDSVLSSLGEKVSSDSLNAALKQINDVKELATLAGPALGLTAEGLAGVIETSGDFSGTMNGIAAILGTTADANDRFRVTQENLQKAFESAGATLPGSTEQFRQMLKGIDLTTDAGQSLYSNLLDLAPAFWQVASAVEGVFEQISKTTAATSEGFAFDVMDQQQRYGFFDSRITDALAQLQSAIDPAAVLELFTKANEDLKSAWQLLDETEKRRLLPQFQDRAMELEAASQARLSVSPLDSPAATPQQIAESVAAAVATAVTDALTAVADTLAGAGEDQSDAANALRDAAMAFRTNANVNVYLTNTGAEVAFA